MSQSPTPSHAAQAVMKSEATENQQKVLQALIEAAAVTDQSLTQRVTIAAVWQYLRLPDSSFGWAGKKDDKGNREPMPLEAKALTVLTTLSLGLLPGVGHALWLGNKVYISADARRFLANRDRELVYSGQRTLRPMSAGEKEMFGIEEGDMHCVLEQPVRFKGLDLTWTGYGIIGKHELDWRDKYDNCKAGMQSKKDCAMHLITRAERDMLNRFYPVNGLGDAPEALLEETEAPSTVLVSTAQPVAQIMEAEEKSALASLRREALETFLRFVGEATKLGLKASEVLGQDASRLTASGSVDELHDASVLLEEAIAVEEAIAAARPPEPTPPADKPKRGRPKGSGKKPAPDVGGLEDVTPATVGAALATEEARAMSPEDPVDVEVSTDPPGSEERTWRPVDALPDDELGDAYEEGGEEALAEAEDFVEPAPPVRANWAGAERDLAVARLRAAIDSCVGRGGAPLKILGYNPHNRIDAGAQSAELDAISDLLEAWAPDKPSVLEKAQAAKASPKPAAPQPPQPPQPPRPTPTTAAVPPKTGRQAHGMIEKALAADVPEPVKARLRDLASRELKDTDHLYLPKAIREGRTGNFRELDELIKGRPVRS